MVFSAPLVPRALRRWLKPPPPSGRQLQLQLDAARLFTLIPSKPLPHHDSNNIEPCPQSEHVADLLGLDSLPSLEHQAAVIRPHLHAAVVAALNATHATLTDQQALTRRFGFHPYVAPSTIPGADRGLFVRGSAPPGALVALYPGQTFLPSQLRALDHPHHLGDYAIQRYDGVVIDGAADVALDVDIDPAELPADADVAIEHPFAHGHMANHPTSAAAPNVLQFMVDIDARHIPAHLTGLIPVIPSELPVGPMERFENMSLRQRVPAVQHFSPNPTPRPGLLRTVALFALRPISDEEVFMDYRFNPAVEPPSWYRSCEGGTAANRRWTTASVFR